MQRFLDKEFTQAGESSEISDELLAIPHLQKPCQEKTDHMVELCFDILKKSFKVFHQPEFSLLLNEFLDQNSDLLDSKSVEDFKSSSDCYCLCTADDAEVIPSSFPDSEVCFDLEYNLDSPEDITAHNPSSELIFDFETATHERMEEGKTLPFEEPIITDKFTQAASRVVETKVLLSRLQMIPVEDPLIDSNGKPWSEQNIFKEDHNLDSLPPAILKPGVIEISDLLSHIRLLQKPSEEYLIPSVVNNSSSSAEYFEILTTNAANLCGQQGFTSKDLDFSDDALLNQECQVFILNIPPDLPNSIGITKSFVDLNNRDAESQCFVSSPFIGFQTPPVSRNYITKDFCQNLEQDLALSSDELQADFDIFASLKGDDLIQEFMEKDLHYDEKRLREPIFQKDALTDPVLEVLQYLDLPFVKDRDLTTEESLLKNLTEDLLEDMGNPSFQVSTLKCKLDEIDPVLVEEHEKIELVKQDSHQDEKIILDSSLHSVKSSDALMSFDEKANSLHIGISPLDTFMFCRNNTLRTKSNEEETLFINNGMKESDTNITCSSEDQSHYKNGQDYASKIMKIPFTGPYTDVMKCITDYFSPHFDKAKQYGRIPHNQSFIDISMDKLRFLYKESEQLYSKDKLINVGSELNELQKNLLQSYALLLHGRITLDLLLHACLESAITHLSSCIDSNDKNVGGSLVHLHENLFKTQLKFMESNCHHPKFTSLTNELEALSGIVDKVMILVPNGMLSLQQALQGMLHRVTSIPIHEIHGKEDLGETSAKQGISIVLEGSETEKEVSEQYSFIIQYNALNPKIKFLCESVGIPYIGFISEVPKKDCCLPPASSSETSQSIPLTVICSNEMTKCKNLVYLLEARYNILIVERNYQVLKLVPSLHYADFILSLHHCIVLLALHEMYDHWDLETFITRMVAVGFQCSFCYVIAHGIGSPSRYLLDKNILLNLYKLRASLSNLSRSSTSFTTTYKVLISSNEDEVALNIRAIADLTFSQEEGNSFTSTIKTDMSKEEILLLQFACFNSYSAQRFLSVWTVDEILRLDPVTIKRNIPNISNDFLATFEALISQKRETDCFSISSESPAVLSVTSSKSHSSVYSTDKGSMTSEFTLISEDDNVSLMPSQHNERSVCENRHNHAIKCKRTQVYAEEQKAASKVLKTNYMNRQEQVLMKNNKGSSFFPEFPDLPSKEIGPQQNFEIKEQRKRSAISNVENENLKISRKKCGFIDLPSNFHTVSERNTNDIHFSMAKEKTAVEYLYEKNIIDESDFCLMTKPHESHHTLMEPCRKRHKQSDCSPSYSDYYSIEYRNSMNCLQLEEAEKNVNISNECIDRDKGLFEENTPQFQNSENFGSLSERTIIGSTYDINGNSHTPMPKSTLYKSYIPISVVLQNAQETKPTNSYGIFSDKIYRTHYKNDEAKNAKQIFNHSAKVDSDAKRTGRQTCIHSSHLNPHAKRTETLNTSSHYLCTENKNIKRESNPVICPQSQLHSPNIYSTTRNPHLVGDISFPFTTSASHRKHVSDKRNHFRYNEDCSRFNLTSGTRTDFCCGSSSFATTIPSRIHKKQYDSSYLQHSAFSCFLQENLKSQDRIDNCSAFFPIDLHNLKIEANKHGQYKEKNSFERDLSQQPSPDVFRSIKNGSKYLYKYCHPKQCKMQANSSKYERPSVQNWPGHFKDTEEDYLSHLSPDSESFIQNAPLFENQTENIQHTSFVPSPPMDFTDEFFRDLSE